VGVVAVLSTSLAWTPEMAPVLLGLVTFGLALSMGVVMAPATDAVMSAVPEAKAGVGSAMSDVTRQVGGATGRELADTAGHAFTEALGIGLTAAAAVAPRRRAAGPTAFAERARTSGDARRSATAPAPSRRAEPCLTRT
jgi:DHA2 family multidrug resistance protein-like MFS transporter